MNLDNQRKRKKKVVVRLPCLNILACGHRGCVRNTVGSTTHVTNRNGLILVLSLHFSFVLLQLHSEQLKKENAWLVFSALANMIVITAVSQEHSKDKNKILLV